MMNIYDLIGQHAVGEIKAYGLDQLPESIHTAILPCRLILPFYTSSGMTTVDFPVQSYHKLKMQIYDLMLFRPVAQGSGLFDVMRDLTDFQAAYIAYCRAFNYTYEKDELERRIDSVRSSINVYEWPLGSGFYFFGVLNDLIVHQFGG